MINKEKMMDVNIDNFMKVNYKVKGNIDINISTAEQLKILEKKGVQINLLMAGLLDGFAYEKAIKKIDGNSTENSFSDTNNESELVNG